MLISLSLTVETVDADITGTVKSEAGKGINGANVTLVGKEVKATTDSSGSFVLKTTTGVMKPLLQPRSTTIALKKGFIDFSLTDASPVKVEIFDLRGDLLKKEVMEHAQKGFYRYTLAENFQVPTLLVIRASIGREVMIFRYLPLNSVTAVVTPSIDRSPVGGTLAKITATVDTIKVTAAEYEAQAVPVSSYDTTGVAITLETINDTTGPVKVRLEQTRQTMEGFGINNTYMQGSLPMNHLFSTEGDGLGMSILRIGMTPTGGVDNSTGLSEAKSSGAKIIGSTWSPQGSWKDNGSTNGGGHVYENKYKDWAAMIASFAAANGLYAMSIGNEPDFRSCGTAEPCNGDYQTTLYTAEEMVKFIKVAGPIFKEKAPGVKLMGPEASEWIHVWSDTSGCCSEPSGKNSSDPLNCRCFQGKTAKCECAPGKGYSYGKYLYEDKEAWAALDILGVHQYDTQRAEPWPDYVKAEDRKPVWQTEMSGVKWWPEQGKSTTIENGIAVAKWIHDAIVIGDCSAWLYWWWEAYYTDDNEGLKLKGGGDTKRHWTFGNFSKFVRPGYKRVNITGAIPKDVLLSAYAGDGGKVVIVAINRGSAAASVPITIAGGTAPASFTPWVTSATDNLKSKDAITVSDGIFTATLAGKTVTTFVSK